VKGIKIERKLVDDDQYSVINKRPQQLALVARRSREKHGASVFNNAFNTTIFAGGDTGATTNVISYVTIDSTGNATDFGDLTQIIYAVCGASNSTRGIFAGGQTDSAKINVIQYITIASTGNATDFGDLITINAQQGACASTTRAVFGGGAPGARTNVIQYVTIATTGNAIDFGDLIEPNYQFAGTSNVHGGL
jgi:hypothetical protein